MNPEDLIIRLGIEGQDEVVKTFQAIGKAAEEAGKSITAALGSISPTQWAAFGAGIVGAATGFAALVKSAAEAGNAIGEFALQTGQSAEDVTALQSAVVSMGGSFEGVEAAYKRLASVAERTWSEVVAEARTARDRQIDDALAVGEANENLFKARQKFAQEMAQLGRPTGIAPVSPFVQQQHEIREAQLALQKVQQQASEQQKRADLDRLNDINNIAAAVEKVVKGEEDVTLAGKSANLEVQNVVKGLVAGATPGAAEALKTFSGNLSEIAQLGPRVGDLFLRIAEFMKNSHDATLNAAVATQLFGRTVGSDLLPILSKGGAAIAENAEAAQRFGLVLSTEAVKGGEAFHQSLNRLSGDIAVLKDEFGLAFAQTFADGLNKIDDALRANAASFKTWTEDISKFLKTTEEEFNRLIAAGDKLAEWMNRINAQITKPGSESVRQMFGLPPSYQPPAPPAPPPAAAPPAAAPGTAVPPGFMVVPAPGAVPQGFMTAPFGEVPLPRERPPEADAVEQKQSQAADKQQQAATTLEQVVNALPTTLAEAVRAAMAQASGPLSAGEQAAMQAQSGMPGASVQDLQQATSGVASSLDTLISAILSAASDIGQAAAKATQSGAVFQTGGLVVGGTPGRDSVPIMAEPHEYVMRSAATQHYGVGFMHLINAMKLPQHFSLGGLIDRPLRGYAVGGPVAVHAAPAVTGRPFVLQIGGESIGGFTASEAAVTAVSRAATQRAVRSGGKKPDWYTGT